MAAALGGALYSQTLGRAGSMLGASRQASGGAMAGQAGCGRKPRLAQPAPYCSSQEPERESDGVSSKELEVLGMRKG